MRLEQLQYILDVAQTRSVSRTAERFYSSHQAVGSSLKQLESELNVCLLNRSPSGVSLTDEGEVVVTFAREIMTSLDKMQQSLVELKPTSNAPLLKTIKVYSASVTTTNHILPKVMDVFSQSYPKVKIRVHDVDAAKIFPAIANKRCDIALISGRKLFLDTQTASFPQGQIVRHNLLEDRLVACLPANSPLADLDYFTVEHIKTHPCTMFSVTFTDEDIDGILKAFVCASNDFEFHKQMLLKNRNAAALMYSYTFDKYFGRKGFIAKQIDGANSIMHTLLHSADPPPLITEFASLIKRHMAK